MTALFRSRSFSRAALVALVCSCGSLHGQLALHTAPVGIMTTVAAAGERGLSFPLIAEDVFVGVVTASSGASVSFAATAGDLTTLLPAGPHYLEVVTGPLAGERLDVASGGAASLTLALGAGTHSTMAALGDGALTGARVVLRPHTTLARIQALVTPALVGNDQFGKADGVEVIRPAGAVFYHLKADGTTWVARQTAAAVNQLVIPPDASVKLVLRSGAKVWLQAGVVRTNPFRSNLAVGAQGFATGFPVALSPSQLGASAANGWTGSSDQDLADSFRSPLLGSLVDTKYYLAADGVTWRRINNGVNVAAQPILGATEFIELRRQSADGAFRIAVPFAP